MADPTIAAGMRAVHLLAIGVLLGGAVLLAGLARGRVAPRTLLACAGPFEPWAWAALGIIVITGIGNAGALGPGLPKPETPWGDRFLLKLGLVSVLLLVSTGRTLLVALAAAAPEPPPGTLRAIGRAYTATAVLMVGIAALGVLLAHG